MYTELAARRQPGGDNGSASASGGGAAYAGSSSSEWRANGASQQHHVTGTFVDCGPAPPPPPVVAYPSGGGVFASGGGAFTGSTTEWHLMQARQQEQAQAYAQRGGGQDDAASRAVALALQQEDLSRARVEDIVAVKRQRRRRIFSVLYNVLTAAELVYFIVGLYVTSWQVADLEDNILLGFTADALQEVGGMHAQRIVDKHQYYRIVTALFIPAGAIHLTASLSMVWVFGQFLTRHFHPGTIVALFLASGISGSIFSANVGAQHVTSGASIPGFGLAGAAAAVLAYRARQFTNHVYSVLMLAVVLALNLFIGATPFVDNSGNVAGFVFGFIVCLCPLLVWHKITDSPKTERLLVILAMVAAVVVGAACVLGIIGLQLDAPIGNCCDQWVCTSSPWWNCDASRIWPSHCSFTSYINGSGLVTCPRGNGFYVPQLNATAPANQLNQLCLTYCNVESDAETPSTGSAGGVS